jgi:multidrug efflux pump subunit AcrA (membrane-fusion protein)
VAASLAAPTFLTIIDLDRLEVRAYVDETDIGRVAVGQRAAVRVDAFPGQPLVARVSAIYPKAQLVNNVVDYVVLLDLEPGSGLLLRPEMTVHVDFVLASRENALVIPRAALFVEGGRSFVRRRAESEWQERDVRTGLETPQRIEIISGLAEGDEIVADRQSYRGNGESEK